MAQISQIKNLVFIMDTNMVCGAALNVVEQLEERWKDAEKAQNFDFQTERFQLLSFAACLMQLLAVSSPEHDRNCLHLRMFATRLVGFAAFSVGGVSPDALALPQKSQEKREENPFYQLFDTKLKALVKRQHAFWAAMNLEDSVVHGRTLMVLSEICSGWPVENNFVSRIAVFVNAVMAKDTPPYWSQ